MALQDVDQSTHPDILVFLSRTLTGSHRLLQPSLAGDYARSRHPKREVTPQDLGQSRAVAALLHD